MVIHQSLTNTESCWLNSNNNQAPVAQYSYEYRVIKFKNIYKGNSVLHQTHIKFIIKTQVQELYYPEIEDATTLGITGMSLVNSTAVYFFAKFLNNIHARKVTHKTEPDRENNTVRLSQLQFIGYLY